MGKLSDHRTDQGLFEQNRSVQTRFWRTHGGAEVDYIEEAGAGQIQAFELKFGNSALSWGAASFKMLMGWT